MTFDPKTHCLNRNCGIYRCKEIELNVNFNILLKFLIYNDILFGTDFFFYFKATRAIQYPINKQYFNNK